MNTYCERQIFIRWPSRNEQDASIVIAFLLDDFVSRCFRFVDEIRIKYVEFVTLYDFGGRVVGAANK